MIREKNFDKYEKLNDDIFGQILNSNETDLEESKKILTRIIERCHYKFLGSSVKSENQNLEKEQIKKNVRLCKP